MAKMIFEISEKMEEDFRNAVFQRKGLRRGVLKEALIEAMNLWIKSDIIEKLKVSLDRSISNGQDYKNLVEALKLQGNVALPTLIDIINREVFPQRISYLAEAIKELSEKKS
jgi:hypothetical protein